ncbi:hypothetical protein [Burkholderia pseudomallei]|uniref:hypothetical protein n=1 Tax=Burkholderia pseudomallei TaxID=28450 RepID=UPI0013923609|nr:hypothetical protein [Burkholderia pseudomallei]
MKRRRLSDGGPWAGRWQGIGKTSAGRRRAAFLRGARECTSHRAPVAYLLPITLDSSPWLMPPPMILSLSLSLSLLPMPMPMPMLLLLLLVQVLMLMLVLMLVLVLVLVPGWAGLGWAGLGRVGVATAAALAAATIRSPPRHPRGESVLYYKS